MISIVTNSYTSQYATSRYADIHVNTARREQEGQTGAAENSSSDHAAKVTLSEAAKAKISEKPYETVIADAHAHMKEILEKAKRTSPLEKGELAVNLSQFDRRELFAMASNADQKFSTDEVKAATLELQRRFDAALAGPLAVARVIDDFKVLYRSASDYLDSMSAEEKATDTWKHQKDAVNEALAQLEADPSSPPSDNEHDPVLDYIRRVDAGEASKERDFSDVASDARAALDKQYEEASAAGKRLSQALDISHFDDRSLSAIALNNEDQFSNSEVWAAKMEIRSRTSKAILAAYDNSIISNDPNSLAKNIIAQYGSMSDEERQAAGWSEDFYNKVVSSYQTSVRISEMFSSYTPLGTSSFGSYF